MAKRGGIIEMTENDVNGVFGQWRGSNQWRLAARAASVPSAQNGACNIGESRAAAKVNAAEMAKRDENAAAKCAAKISAKTLLLKRKARQTLTAAKKGGRGGARGIC